MLIEDILYTFLLNALPLIILIIPAIFIRKMTVGKLYIRIVIGIVFFYLIYWILPIIFQIGLEPDNLGVSDANEGNALLGIIYIGAHMGSLIAIFASYPLITLPFIFFGAPFFSFLILWNYLRKQEGTATEKLTQLTYEMKKSPFKLIRDEIIRNDWKREKEILKLMIVLLPISLYLLQVILNISGLQSVSLTEGSTALGWFLEILFVYLATFIFGIELLLSSKIAFGGKFFGEDIREQTFKSLYTVGTPISILSIILFVVQYTESIGVIIYFFAYFIMASVIFILFLDIFEPISILLLIKIINWWKVKKERSQIKDYSNIYYILFFALLAVIIIWVTNAILGTFIFIPAFGNSTSESYLTIFQSKNFTYQDPTLYNTLNFDLMNIFVVVIAVISVIVLAIFISLGMKYVRETAISYIFYFAIVIIFSFIFLALQQQPPINFAADEYWLTGRTSVTSIFGFNFYTLRTAAFTANLNVEGGVSLLTVLAIPYLYCRYIFAIVVWSLIFFYISKDFKTKSIPIDEKNVEKIFFSEYNEFIKIEEYNSGKVQYLIAKNEDQVKLGIEKERDEVKELIGQLTEERMLSNLMPEDSEERKRFYYTLKYLWASRYIQIWKPEFKLRFEKVEKQGLYVMYTDGRDVFNYAFVEDQNAQTDPALISGMFSAITSFIQETTKSAQVLKTIDHGDISIMIEYGDYIFSALFIKGKQSSEVRAQLREFVNQFEEKHGKILNNWNGALSHFKEDHLLVQDIFTEQ